MKLGSLNLTTFFIFFKIALCISVSMNFLVNFRISLSISAKKRRWDFDRDWVEFIDQLVEYCHPKDRVFWSMNMGYLCIYLDINFFQWCFTDFQYKFYALKKLIPKYFIFYTLLNGIVFLIVFLNYYTFF